ARRVWALRAASGEVGLDADFNLGPQYEASERGAYSRILFRSFSFGRLLRPTWSSTLKVFQEESFCSKPVFQGSAAGLLGQPHFVRNFIFLLPVDCRTRRGRLRFSLFPGHHLPPLSY